MCQNFTPSVIVTAAAGSVESVGRNSSVCGDDDEVRVATESEAKLAEIKPLADVVEAAPAVELPAGAKAPLKSGGAPQGYDIKGNADSGLYHEPDGQWYAATVAEFYFKTAEDAEAAGFTRAGGGSDAEEDDK